IPVLMTSRRGAGLIGTFCQAHGLRSVGLFVFIGIFDAIGPSLAYLTTFPDRLRTSPPMSIRWAPPAFSAQLVRPPAWPATLRPTVIPMRRIVTFKEKTLGIGQSRSIKRRSNRVHFDLLQLEDRCTPCDTMGGGGTLPSTDTSSSVSAVSPVLP